MELDGMRGWGGRRGVHLTRRRRGKQENDDARDNLKSDNSRAKNRYTSIAFPSSSQAYSGLFIIIALFSWYTQPAFKDVEAYYTLKWAHTMSTTIEYAVTQKTVETCNRSLSPRQEQPGLMFKLR
jgi:hypothetical protein